MSTPRQGFTLIELAIVLVIIGLLVGGVLVGRDLIQSAEMSAQVAQITSYNAAVNTFHDKYGGIPGDLSLTRAGRFGFTVGTNCDSSHQGWRDGNGVIDGSATPFQLAQGANETGLFWQDLSTAGYINGAFPNNGAAAIACEWGNNYYGMTLTPGTSYLGDYFPSGKIGHGTFVYVYELNGNNWFGLSTVTSVSTGGELVSTSQIPVFQAYGIDKKADDGLPATGSIRAIYISSLFATQLAPNALSDSNSTCYNTSGAGSYSTSVDDGTDLNCALSFRFQ